jgi:hypothetical protein
VQQLSVTVVGNPAGGPGLNPKNWNGKKRKTERKKEGRNEGKLKKKHI